MDEQPPALAVGLQVEPRNEPVAKQEGKDVVAVLAFIGRRVNLDPVVKVEQPQRAGALPDERIERREKRPRGQAARPACVAVKIGEMRPARNLDRYDNTGLEERLDRLPRLVRAETKIVAQILGRGDAERESCAFDKGAMRLLLVRVGRARISAGMTRSVRS